MGPMCSLGVLAFLATLAHAKVSYDVGSSSATIRWSSSSDAKLFLQRLDKERSLPIAEEGRNGEHHFNSLVPGAAYRLDVTPRDGERETVKFNTKPKRLETIRSSKFFRQSTESTDGGQGHPIYGAVLYWTPPEGTIDGYVLDIQPKHGEIKAPVLQKEGELVQDKTQPRRVITGLEPGQEYNFTISSTSGREVSTPTTLSTRIRKSVRNVTNSTQFTLAVCLFLCTQCCQSKPFVYFAPALRNRSAQCTQNSCFSLLQ
jgi:hypothetical protein